MIPRIDSIDDTQSLYLDFIETLKQQGSRGIEPGLCQPRSAGNRQQHLSDPASRCAVSEKR